MGKPESRNTGRKPERSVPKGAPGQQSEELIANASRDSRIISLRSQIMSKQLQLSQARGNSNRMKGHRQRLKMDIINLRDELYRVSDKKYGSKHPGGGYYEGGERVTAYNPTLPRMVGNPEKVDWAEAGRRENKRLSDLDAARRNTPPKTAQLGGGSYGPGGIYRPNSIYRPQDINAYSPLRNGIQGLNEQYPDPADADRAVRNFYGMPEQSAQLPTNATQSQRMKQRAFAMASSGKGNAEAALYEAQLQRRAEIQQDLRSDTLEAERNRLLPLKNRLMELTKTYKNFKTSSYKNLPEFFKKDGKRNLVTLLKEVHGHHDLAVQEINSYWQNPDMTSRDINGELERRIGELEAAHRGLNALRSSGPEVWNKFEQMVRMSGKGIQNDVSYNLAALGNGEPLPFDDVDSPALQRALLKGQEPLLRDAVRIARDKWATLPHGLTYTVDGKSYPFYYWYNTKTGQLFARSDYPMTRTQMLDEKTGKWTRVVQPQEIAASRSQPAKKGNLETLRTERAALTTKIQQVRETAATDPAAETIKKLDKMLSRLDALSTRIENLENGSK